MVLDSVYDTDNYSSTSRSQRSDKNCKAYKYIKKQQKLSDQDGPESPNDEANDADCEEDIEPKLGIEIAELEKDLANLDLES